MTASEQVMARKWEYRVTEPNLPLGAKSPVMDSQQMQEWLNRMDDYGWEFVGYGATHWRGYSVPQELVDSPSSSPIISEGRNASISSWNSMSSWFQ
jgi:hypothetical protein